MRLMRKPLGCIDNRVTMTDTPPEGFLSPSFASVIAFGDLPQHENAALDELPPRNREMNPTGRIMTEQLGEALDGRDGKRYPRLELDPTMDKYHTLDGLAEPKNPQNTPASNSGCDSPRDAPRRDNGEGLRTSSAPATPALTINWFEDPPDEDSIYLPGDEEDSTKNQTRRFSADDKPRSNSPITVPKGAHLQAAVDASLVGEDIGTAIATLRCVRFTPPLYSSPARSPPRSPRPVNRPLPSVERKQDYISTYRQQKQNAKWKGLNRARAQRVSPNRSPVRASQPSSNPVSGQPGIRFLSPSKSAFGDDRSRLTGLFQSSSDQEAPEMPGALTDESTVTNGFAPSRQACDLAVISFSLYRFRYPGSSRAGVLQVRMNSTIIPLKPSLQEGKTNKTVVTRMAVDDLLLHTYVVVPALMLRLPLLGVSAAKQFKHSRLGLAAIQLWKMFWVLALRALYFVMLKLGQDVYYHSEPRPPRQKKKCSA
ncbi:uncharacterized protein N7498_001477 [Penicillium cinerascens]|uniref:Uncharacterized protein n=1 Tax=Penicillium cinerascens TaxID=70096 RepID=A0A9W9TE62_9EURO|nr:uncharacterized protein N7498_001477 [Penicillium cinerascens]KAJ5219378.1 hypothetical protein N7498_001477 [Penicillium cinerascens]